MHYSHVPGNPDGKNAFDIPSILRNLRSGCFCLFTLLALALSMAFVANPLGRIKFEDVRDADPKYANFLSDVVFSGNKYEFVRLQTLGEYSTFTASPEDDGIFGLTEVQTDTIRPRLESIFKSPLVKKYMQIPSFVGLNGKQIVTDEIVMASPLWVFEHNLQMRDEAICGNTSTMLIIQNSNLIDAQTGEIIAWDGVGRACVPSTPTAVNYRRCYENLERHRIMVGVQVVVWILLLFIHTVVLFIPHSEAPGRAALTWMVLKWTNILQGGALVAVISLELFEWSHGITATVYSASVHECPDKQTGLAAIYQCLLAAHVFKWFSLVLLCANLFPENTLRDGEFV